MLRSLKRPFSPNVPRRVPGTQSPHRRPPCTSVSALSCLLLLCIDLRAPTPPPLSERVLWPRRSSPNYPAYTGLDPFDRVEVRRYGCTCRLSLLLRTTRSRASASWQAGCGRSAHLHVAGRGSCGESWGKGPVVHTIGLQSGRALWVGGCSESCSGLAGHTRSEPVQPRLYSGAPSRRSAC